MLLYTLLLLLLNGNGVKSVNLMNHFIEDVISAFKFTAPTIFYIGEVPEYCTVPWVLCIENDSEENLGKLVRHLNLIHRDIKQDGIIFIGRQGTESLLTHLTLNTSSIFTSNYPVFMPTSYKSSIKLRLDSNILF